MDTNEHSSIDTQQPQQTKESPAGPNQHSGLGIASFVIAMVAILFIVFIFVVSAASLSNISEHMTEEEIMAAAPGLVIAGLLLFSVILMNLVGSVLGIIALFNKRRKRLFAILGTIFNLLGFLALILLIIMGITMQTMV